MPKLGKLWTSRDVARELGQPIHKVEYVLRKRTVEPTCILGGHRLFDIRAVNQIEALLAVVAAGRVGGRARSAART